jgi:hypothetical protein
VQRFIHANGKNLINNWTDGLGQSKKLLVLSEESWPKIGVSDLGLTAHTFLAGQRSSICFMISCAQRIESSIAPIVAGTRFPPSYWANFRAARIAAAIRNHALAAFVHDREFIMFAFDSPTSLHLDLPFWKANGAKGSGTRNYE